MDNKISRVESNPRTYPASTSTVTPLITPPEGVRSIPVRVVDSFRSGPSQNVAPALGGVGNRTFNAKAAAYNTANTSLVRRLRGRHLQMIAIGGSIGTGLFVGCGQSLALGGPASLLIAFVLIGAVLYCTVQALGEMAVTFPVAGSFSAFATRFLDPAWGFACGWNYAMQWLIVMPIEVISAAITLEYWDLPIPRWIVITMFLTMIIGINMCSVKLYGEAEYAFSIMKVTAIIGFIILGVVINCGGGQDSGYIGGKFWSNPGAFHNGFKGFCNILVTATFSFSGTELVGLAAAETHNPGKALPTAIKQVFWRIAIFYVISIGIIGILVPYTDPQLISRNDVNSKVSPFIIAIKNAGIHGLDSIMNGVIVIAVLSVANSAMYGSTRTLAALAVQGQAPSILAYVDRKGRPLVAILVAAAISGLAYLYISPIKGPAFTWLLALSGLSTIFTWGSICLAHTRFRKAWLQQGNLISDLVYVSPIGSVGSWMGFLALITILVAQFWVAISPSGAAAQTARERATNFFEAYLAVPVVLTFFAFYKIYYRTRWVRIAEVDLMTGRLGWESEVVRKQVWEDRSMWPRWKVWYKTMC